MPGGLWGANAWTRIFLNISKNCGIGQNMINHFFHCEEIWDSCE